MVPPHSINTANNAMPTKQCTKLFIGKIKKVLCVFQKVRELIKQKIQMITTQQSVEHIQGGPKK